MGRLQSGAMNPCSVLLRVALAIVLILNGAGAAAASVTLETEVAESAPTEIAAASGMSLAGAEMPCHETMAVPPDTAATPAAAAHPSDDGHPAAPDCCKTAACHCTCVQAAHAALPAMPALGFVPAHSDASHPMPIGHAEPALPHLVRPPIG